MLRIVALALAMSASASAFVVSSPKSNLRTVPLRDAVQEPSPVAEASGETAPVEEAPKPPVPVKNGWAPDESKFAYGLPGSVAPIPEFDPLGFAKGATLGQMKRYREAEVTHGRVAMLAVLGFLTAESFHPLFGGQISGPAIYHLTEVRQVAPVFFELLAILIGISETRRAQIGWVPPTDRSEGSPLLRESYYPGDIGFDPMGLKPTDAAEFANMQTKELQNGRLAMLASMGFIVQELVNNKGILENLSS